MSLLVFFRPLGFHGDVLLVYPLLLCQFSFLTFFLFLGATAKILLGWISSLGFPVVVSLNVPP